ncbi:MAG: MBL fold metallo-hydrolase, partial [Planctomycetota bacterium]|nr:MBL fold metallo-hydrolase [Planctomycetota bacterium]
MRIKWLGHASFLIESSGVKIVTDPYREIGLEFPKIKADIVTVS